MLQTNSLTKALAIPAGGYSLMLTQQQQASFDLHLKKLVDHQLAEINSKRELLPHQNFLSTIAFIFKCFIKKLATLIPGSDPQEFYTATPSRMIVELFASNPQSIFKILMRYSSISCYGLLCLLTHHVGFIKTFEFEKSAVEQYTSHLKTIFRRLELANPGATTLAEIRSGSFVAVMLLIHLQNNSMQHAELLTLAKKLLHPAEVQLAHDLSLHWHERLINPNLHARPELDPLDLFATFELNCFSDIKNKKALPARERSQENKFISPLAM